MGLLTNFAQDAVPVTTAVPITEITTTTDSSSWLGVFAGVWLFFWLAFLVITIIAYWKIFTKAGEAGWKSIIPIWNAIVLLRIVGRPWWWILLLLIPVVNIAVLLVVSLDLGKSFGKDPVFSVILLFFLSTIGYLILGFGDAKYGGPSGKGPSTAAAPVAN